MHEIEKSPEQNEKKAGWLASKANQLLLNSFIYL